MYNYLLLNGFCIACCGEGNPTATPPAAAAILLLVLLDFYD
jgi:hypothetical protein